MRTMFLTEASTAINKDEKMTVLETSTDRESECFLLDFFVKEYIGKEVIVVTPELRGLPHLCLCDESNWPVIDDGTYLHHKPSQRKEDMREGVQVLVKSLRDGQWSVGTVERRDGGRLCVTFEGSDTYCLLDFCDDDRKCWVAACWINSRALTKVRFGHDL